MEKKTIEISLLILGCSATKRHDADLMPALQRYDGPMYRVLRKALRERPGLADRLKICVLSAEHGLISANTPIADYDRRMTRELATNMRPKVVEQANEIFGGIRWPGFIACGKTYSIALPAQIWYADMRSSFGGIGCQLAQLKTWLGGLP